MHAVAAPPSADEAVRVYDVLLAMVSGVSVPLEKGRVHPPLPHPACNWRPDSHSESSIRNSPT
jgi:hypothetical protein